MSERNSDALLQHPKLWRAGQMRAEGHETLDTGYPTLNQHLNGGWPASGLTEVMSKQFGIGELRLFVPLLRQLAQAQNRWIAWIDPPHVPYPPALRYFGIALDRILLINTQQPKASLWALERAARSGALSCVLAWPERFDPRASQRVQVAAKQGNTLVCVFRKPTVNASMAELRLTLRHLDEHGLHLDITKRRGGWPLHDLCVPIAPSHRSAAALNAQLEHWRAWQNPAPAAAIDEMTAGYAGAALKPEPMLPAPRDTGRLH